MTVTVNWKLEHYNGLDATGSPDNIIKSFSSINVTTTAGDGRDSFQFELKSDEPVVSDIDINDKVVINREVNSSQFDADSVVMNAAINKTPRKEQTSKDIVQVKGNNYSKTLADATVFRDVSNIKVDEAIQQALNSIKNYAKGFGVDWNSNNPTLKTNGTEFPEVGEKWYDVPMRKIMEDMTKDKYTEDGDYFWYVDANNELVWRPETDTVSDIINANFPYKTIEESRDTEDVVNFVKVKGGTLPTGGVVEAQHIDFGSAGKNGLRFKAIQGNENYVTNNHSETMVAIGATENDTRPSEVSGFSYPLTVGPVADFASNTINNDEDYFDSLKKLVQNKLEQDGVDYVTNNKAGYIELDMEVNPADNVFQLGELFDMRLDGYPQDPFRVREIQYTSTIDVIRLREDEPSVGA